MCYCRVLAKRRSSTEKLSPSMKDSYGGRYEDPYIYRGGVVVSGSVPRRIVSRSVGPSSSLLLSQERLILLPIRGYIARRRGSFCLCSNPDRVGWRWTQLLAPS